MNREVILREVEDACNRQQKYDFIIIGGGATGIGIALEAVTRGYKTLLLEKSDFTKSTSSKSTKLLHGGLRYLAQGDVALVREACVERGRLLNNAPHVTNNQSFIIPANGLFDELKYTLGLKIYDLLAGYYGIGKSYRLSKKDTLERLPAINPDKISAGIVYHDGQFDDCRMAINALQSAVEQGAHVLNYMEVRGLIKSGSGLICGVTAMDTESGKHYEIPGSAVINATGVFADDILDFDIPGHEKTIRPSQGVHLVVDKSFLPGDYAMMIPKTDDGRVLFAVPWHNRIVLGTTDTPIEAATLEPVPMEQEIDFILSTAGKYLLRPPKRCDVLSVFAGLRPLAAPRNGNHKTREISRSHKIFVSGSHLFSIVGGKWTTFRRMGQDLVDKVERIKKWPKTKSCTKNYKLHGYNAMTGNHDLMCIYGSDKNKILNLSFEEPGMDKIISSSLDLTKAQVVWAVRHEMARNPEDVLARRTRCLFLDARESIRISDTVTEIIAAELNRGADWKKLQSALFAEMAGKYLCD